MMGAALDKMGAALDKKLCRELHEITSQGVASMNPRHAVHALLSVEKT